MKKRNGISTRLVTVCAACLILAASCSQSSQTPVGFTPGRTTAVLIAVAGLISSVIGVMSLRAARRTGAGKGLTGALVALLLGLIVIVLSVVHLGNSGGFGTGGGRAGAIVALVLGLTGTTLGGLALARARRTD